MSRIRSHRSIWRAASRRSPAPTPASVAPSPRRWPRAGADIALIGRSDPAETLAAVEALGRRAHWVNADLGSQARLRGASSARSSAKLGGLHILVNNAGIIRRNNAIDFTEADWDAVLDVNLKSVFFLSQAAARHMIPERRRQDHQHRLDAVVPGRHPRARPTPPARAASPASRRLLANEWAGVRHQRQRHRARLLRHQQHRRAAGRRQAQRGNPRRAFPPGAGEIPRNWAAPRYSSPRARPTTCRASSCRSTAAGWRADRRYHAALDPWEPAWSG